jgi:pimeloyl-ACP methyl ester carboxylesterase
MPDRTPELRTARANDLDVAYLEMGEGPLALCLHGFPDSAHTWRHLLPQLADAGFRAVAPFLRGYAPTSLAPDGAYQSGVLGVDANALHEVLGATGDSVIIGHDWGASGVYGATNIEPDRWRRAVVMAVPPSAVVANSFFTYDQLRLSWYMFFFQHPLAEMVVPMADYDFVAKLWRDWSPGYDYAEDVANFVACVPDAAHFEAVINYYRHTIGGVDNRGELGDAQAATFTAPPHPTLYLHGRDDGCMAAALAEGAADFLPGEGSAAHILDGCGHFLHLERPDEVGRLVIDFVS